MTVPALYCKLSNAVYNGGRNGHGGVGARRGWLAQALHQLVEGALDHLGIELQPPVHRDTEEEVGHRGEPVRDDGRRDLLIPTDLPQLAQCGQDRSLGDAADEHDVRAVASLEELDGAVRFDDQPHMSGGGSISSPILSRVRCCFIRVT